MKAVTGSDLNIEKDSSFLLLCNDIIVDILKYADLNKWDSEYINIKEKDRKKWNSKKYDIIYWRENGYASTINKYLYKTIVFSLVSDYNKYMYEAICSASKYHVGPAYTLIRKPFKDNLLLLEMMYVKKYRFVSDFCNNSIDDFAIDNIVKDKNKLMYILRKSCNKLCFFTAKEMYDLRYNKKSKVSLEKIWNPASHIITSCKHYHTNDANLNMVFVSDEIIENYLVYFYKVCCSVQLYFIKLLLNILLEEKIISNEIFKTNNYNITYAYFCSVDNQLTDEVINNIFVKCEYCQSTFNVNREILKNGYNDKDFSFKCIKCDNTNNITGFINY